MSTSTPLVREDIHELSSQARVALFAATLEKAAPHLKDSPQVQALVKKLAKATWEASRVVTQREASAHRRPEDGWVSNLLYNEFAPQLYDLDARNAGTEHSSVIGFAMDLFISICSVLNMIEMVRLAKPRGLATSDIVESGLKYAVRGLDFAVQAAPDPEEAAEWQRTAYGRLLAQHPYKDDDPVGEPVDRATLMD